VLFSAQQHEELLACCGACDCPMTMPACCGGDASACGSFLASSMNRSSTLAAVFAEVSTKNKPFSLAYASASSA
jgi:hypothetical protein